jgi:hypothetical protein
VERPRLHLVVAAEFTFRRQRPAWYAGALHVHEIRQQLLDGEIEAKDADPLVALTTRAGPWLPEVF